MYEFPSDRLLEQVFNVVSTAKYPLSAEQVHERITKKAQPQDVRHALVCHELKDKLAIAKTTNSNLCLWSL